MVRLIRGNAPNIEQIVLKTFHKTHKPEYSYGERGIRNALVINFMKKIIN